MHLLSRRIVVDASVFRETLLDCVYITTAPIQAPPHARPHSTRYNTTRIRTGHNPLHMMRGEPDEMCPRNAEFRPHHACATHNTRFCSQCGRSAAMWWHKRWDGLALCRDYGAWLSAAPPDIFDPTYSRPRRKPDTQKEDSTESYGIQTTKM